MNQKQNNELLKKNTKAIFDEKNKCTKIVGILQDITEQRLKEISLLEIGEEFDQVQRVAGVGSWEYDVIRDEFYGTDEVFNIFGISRAECNNGFSNILKLIHPEDRHTAQDAMRIHRAGGQPCSIELRIPQKNGTVKYVISKAEPVFNSEGNVVGVFGTLQDVTENKLLHENLKRSYKSLIEAERLAKLGSWEIDIANKKLVFCSDELYNMYGISKEPTDNIDILALMDFIHPDDRAIIRDIYNNPPLNQPVHVEFRLVRPDGSVLYTYNILEMTFDEDGKLIFMRGTTQDITEKKKLQKEAELKQKKINLMQRKFNALVKESVEVFEILDVDGHITYISDTSEKVIGYKPEERIGRKIFDFYTKEEGQKLSEMMAYVLGAHGRKITKDAMFKTKSGKQIALEIKMQNFLNDPAIKGIVVNFRDITDRVKAEKKIIHLSTHDQLTGLPNKLNFERKIEQLAKSVKEYNSSFAILMLDIDSYSYIKNTLGNKAAEQYIIQISIKLKLYCGSKYICHYAYNRFVIISKGTHGKDDYEAFIKGILELFSKPLTVDKYELDVDVSIGVSFYTGKREELVRQAETAIFLAKNEGRNKYIFYSPDLDIKSYKYFTLRNDLKKAIELYISL
jgi:diguanylate cyclase (GGDEF)-like protein/PAS domain S-box-containing protein